ncbi:Lactose permease [Klebsiella variicola]|nr:Lactose permease [Klebsiella variicola]
MIMSNKNYFISCLFFLFFFIGWGCCYPYLSLWLTETIGINYTDVGLVYSFTAIVAVCVQPLFGFISDKLVYRKNLMWMLAIIITLFAPYWIYVFAPLLKINVFLGALAGGLYIGMAYGAGCGVCEAYIDKSQPRLQFRIWPGADVRRHRRRDRHLCGRKTLRH